jgi:hypothetical protein
MKELPTPWNGRRGARRFPRLAHEHGELRSALRKLEMAVSQPACPPPGHAFLGLVQAMGTYFPGELAAHTAEEEAQLYPQLPASEVAALVVEHRQLAVLAARFQGLATTPDEPRWGALRVAAAELASALKAHLHHEEGVIDRAEVKPSEGAAGSP